MNRIIKNITAQAFGIVSVGLFGTHFLQIGTDPWLLQQELFLQANPLFFSLTPQYDFEGDSSIQKFLDAQHPFADPHYQPLDLLPIPSDFTFNNARRFQLRKEAGEQFADMARHFWSRSAGKGKLSINSAYRSYAFQARLSKNCYSNHCADAGTSEHQAGLAIDLGVNGGKLTTHNLQWLKDNAHKRGFHQSYQKGVEIDGKIIEDWHWRYLGTGLATELWEKQMSFTERYYQLQELENAPENTIL